VKIRTPGNAEPFWGVKKNIGWKGRIAWLAQPLQNTNWCSWISAFQ